MVRRGFCSTERGVWIMTCQDMCSGSFLHGMSDLHLVTFRSFSHGIDAKSSN